MLESTYSEEKKLFLFQDWLGCNGDSLNELWLDSDFMSGFRNKCFWEASTELKNRGRYKDLQESKKEIEGLIDEFLYVNVLWGIKNTHIKKDYKFKDIKPIYSIIHERIRYDGDGKSKKPDYKFRKFFIKYFDNEHLSLDEVKKQAKIVKDKFESNRFSRPFRYYHYGENAIEDES